jgi:hypothetical protein
MKNQPIEAFVRNLAQRKLKATLDRNIGLHEAATTVLGLRVLSVGLCRRDGSKHVEHGSLCSPTDDG